MTNVGLLEWPAVMDQGWVTVIHSFLPCLGKEKRVIVPFLRDAHYRKAELRQDGKDYGLRPFL